VAFNPGAEWSVDGEKATRYMRICYAHPSVQDIRSGIELLARVCKQQYPDMPIRGVAMADAE
jgi:2-aminoadipate transaminase